MNIKLITKAMHTLSLLSEDDVQMVMKLRGLSEDERQMLMLVLEPQKPQKKSSKKSVGKGGGKSKHASSLQQQIGNRAQSSIQPPRAASGENEDDRRCVYKLGEDIGGRPVICDAAIDNNVHHKQTDPDYHPFQPAEQAAVASGD